MNQEEFIYKDLSKPIKREDYATSSEFKAALSLENVIKMTTAAFDTSFSKKVFSYILEPTTEINFLASTQDEYNKTFGLRHDAVLMSISNKVHFQLDLSIGDYMKKMKLEAKISPINEKLTPDIITFKEPNTLEIGELTISSRPNNAYKIKKTKYSFLIYELSKFYTIDYKVTVFQETGEPYQDEIGFPPVSREIIIRFNRLINHFMQNNPEFESNRLRSKDYISDFSKVQLEPEIVYSPDFTSEDGDFMNKIVNLIIRRPLSFQRAEINPEELYSYYRSLRQTFLINVKDESYEKQKATFKFPYYSTTINRNRDTTLDQQLLSEIVPQISDVTGIEFKPTVDNPKYSVKHLFHANLSQNDKRIIALDGPGSKRFLTADQKLLKRNRLSNFIHDIDSDQSDLTSFLATSQASRGDYKDIESFESENVICQFLEKMELLAREISLNSMRKGRKKNFVISPTDLKDVYIILFPGPPLRASQVNSVVWVKFISKCSILYKSLNQRHWESKGIIQTRWLSYTSKKLDHYIRSKDQVLMAYYSYISLSQPLEVAIMQDTSDTLALMAALWSEDLRQTSSTLHDFRYFIMQKISIVPNFTKLLSKLKIPIRSPLLFLCIKRMLTFLTKPISFEDTNQQLTEENIEKFGGSLTSSRVITSGGLINFHQLINEMYFSMLFNKNEQEASLDSLQILDKILESEEQFQESKSLGLVDIQGFDEEKISKIMYSDYVGGYSAEAIKIGVKLQLKSPHNKAGLSAPKIAVEKKNLNKQIEKFATLKSSSINGSENERAKCLLEATKILVEGLETSFDVANRYRDHDIQVQLFKKNQIGGVREISILDMRSRIKTNIVETYFRNLCSLDDREMLTKGSQKFDTMRLNNKATIGKTKFYVNGDATRWAQSFHTHQFKYLIGCHDVPIVGYVQKLFQDFTKKKIFPPKALTDLWLRYPEEKGHDKLLDARKKIYLETGVHSIENESNMCQGILHYTSSYLHCCLLSFIEHILARISQTMRLNITVSSQVSSDDYMITIMTDIKQSTELKRSLDKEEVERLKERVTKLRVVHLISRTVIIYCQRLFNVHDSSKTSVTSTIYEFNSCFALRFTFLSPTIKFAIASTEPINTDSPARMVSEGLNRVNQLIENGGSIELAKQANRMNRKYVEEITGLIDQNLPYEVGVYPSEDSTVELFMFGAKFHNCKLIQKMESLTIEQQSILSGVISQHFADPTEMAANLMYDDLKQHGKIILKTAPSKNWINLIKQLPFDRDSLNSKLELDPLIVMKRTLTKDEQIVRCCLKAYTSNVRESIRNTSPSIYYARYSAYKSALAFTTNYKDLLSYMDVINSLKVPIISKEQLSERYPDFKDMQLISNLEKVNFKVALENRPKFQSKRLLRLRMVTAVNHIRTNVIDLVSYKWLKETPDVREVNQFERDWLLLKTRVPYLLDDSDQTIDFLMGTHNLSRKTSIALLFKSLNYAAKEISFERKLFSYGSTTYSILDTFKTLYYENQFSTKTSKMTVDTVTNKALPDDLLSINSIYDYFMRYSDISNLIKFLKSIKIGHQSVFDDLVLHSESIYYSYDDQYNRRKFSLAALHLGVISQDTFVGLMSQHKVVLRQWLLPQILNNGVWIGDFSVIYYCRNNSLNINYSLKADQYKFKAKLGDDWNELLGLCMQSFIRDFNLDFQSILSKTQRGDFMFNNSPVSLFKSPGILISVDSSLSSSFGDFKVTSDTVKITLSDSRGILLSSYITIDPIHINYTMVDDTEEEIIMVNGFNIRKLIRHQFLLDSFNINNVRFNTCNFDPMTIVSKVKPTAVVSKLLRHLNFESDSGFEINDVVEQKEPREESKADLDAFMDEMINIDEATLNDLSKFTHDMTSNGKDEEKFYGGFEMELDDTLVNLLSSLLNPTTKVNYNKLVLRDVNKIDQFPYEYFEEKVYKGQFSAMTIYSILKNRGYDHDWQFNFLVFIANKIIQKPKLAGRYDPEITFDSAFEEYDFSEEP